MHVKGWGNPGTWSTALSFGPPPLILLGFAYMHVVTQRHQRFPHTILLCGAHSKHHAHEHCHSSTKQRQLTNMKASTNG